MKLQNQETFDPSPARSETCAEPVLAAKWDFTYDGDGVRTGQSYTEYTDGLPGTPVITRYYFGGAWKKYYSFGGTTLMRDASGFKYFLSDHLGSVSAVLDENGGILERRAKQRQPRSVAKGHDLRPK